MVTLHGKNFEALKATFRTDTGLDASKPENISLYIQYFHAKVADYQLQVNAGILDELSQMNQKIRGQSGIL